MPTILGGILEIPTYNAVPDTGLLANKLAISGNIGDVSEGKHTYIHTNNWSESCSEEGIFLVDALPRLLCWKP